MAGLRTVRMFWKNLDIKSLTADIVNEHSQELADINRRQMYEKGERADGKPLRTYASDIYARKKYAMNPLPGYRRPDFFKTGEFHKSIFATADEVNNRLLFGSTDSVDKVAFLLGRDGKEVLGIQMANQRTAEQIVRPPLIRKLSELSGCPYK